MDLSRTATSSAIAMSLLFVLLFVDQSRSASEKFERNRLSAIESFSLEKEVEGTRWAVLVAGSNGYMNYRHQADVCHAYQILKKGGLEDKHIIVFMYDDIAYNELNPRKGIIINHPDGPDVYKGVPKDYTAAAVNVNNLLAVILGDEKSLTGGSGKVVNSGPNDRIFIYYADHGSPGLVGMPGSYLLAPIFIKALKRKHASKTYKSMVIYMEACEGGSMFNGLLPDDLNIYATTAANTNESSYAIYCPGDPNFPTEYDTCLGDLYSVSWMEDSERQNRETETIEEQYKVVKNRTLYGDPSLPGSHVMQYGNITLSKQKVSDYIGTRETTNTYRVNNPDSRARLLRAVDQRDADIIHLMEKVRRAPKGSKEKLEAQEVLEKELSLRSRIDKSIEIVGQILFEMASDEMLKTVRPAGKPLVDDWDCFKTLIDTYVTHCGSLSSYGLKYTRAFANMCNVGVDKAQLTRALEMACI